MGASSTPDSHDVEKNPIEASQIPITKPERQSAWHRISKLGVELRGVQPVSLDERHDKHPINMLSFWSTVGITLLA
jgi:hypothetical protein